MEACRADWMIGYHNSQIPLTCTLMQGHDGPHLSADGGVRWELTKVGESANHVRAERDRYLNSPEYQARSAKESAESAAAQQRFMDILTRKQATRRHHGQAVLDRGDLELAYCRTPDIFDEHHQRLNQPKTHIVFGDRLASGHHVPAAASGVAGPDSDHPLCKSCIEGLAKFRDTPGDPRARRVTRGEI